MSDFLHSHFGHYLTGTALSILGICFVVIALASFCVLWNLIKIPRNVYEAHIQLRIAIKGVNNGVATQAQKEMVSKARAMRMVSGSFYVNAKGKLVVKLYYNNRAAELLSLGVYGTDTFDAELEQYRIHPPSSG